MREELQHIELKGRRSKMNIIAERKSKMEQKMKAKVLFQYINLQFISLEKVPKGLKLPPMIKHSN